MVKTQSSYVCQQCGYVSSGWLGKCPSCGTWNSLVEQVEEKASKSTSGRRIKAAKLQSLFEVRAIKKSRLSTGSLEFDRVLGGGIVTGSVILLAGEPGIGKSTMLLRLSENFSKNGNVLYVSGEESPTQIKLRAARLGIDSKKIFLSSETDVDSINLQIIENKPSLVIVDSIQTLVTEDLTGTAGSVGQVRECANRLQKTAKDLNIPLFLIGHVTKEGAIAGPKVLEHLVDAVLYLEGERFHSLRILRGVKNRFGPTDEVGVYAMEEKGLVDVSDPERLFLGEGQKTAPGSAIVVAQEGTRPILVEIQALVNYSKLPAPRRIASGVDYNRLQMLVAVISKHLRLPVGDYDIYVNVASGYKISEPAADLGICLSIISSFKNKALPAKSVALGEVGLLGEIRSVTQEEKRIKEARKLGFTNILSANQKTLTTLARALFE